MDISKFGDMVEQEDETTMSLDFYSKTSKVVERVVASEINRALDDISVRYKVRIKKALFEREEMALPEVIEKNLLLRYESLPEEEKESTKDMVKSYKEYIEKNS